MRSEYLKHLKQQIGFIKRSCDSFDAGHTDEAIRIATSLRILLHNTGQSVSLMKHLDALDISLLSTVIDRDAEIADQGPNDTIVIFGGLFCISEATDVSLQACLDGGETRDLVSITKWLNQIVSSTRSRIRVTRRDIILGATNKDGGAHVDLKLPVPYQVAAGESPMGFFMKKPGVAAENPLEKTHLVSLRQMGYEILNSPGVQSLNSES
jgi:hypothetical protein